MSGPQGASSRFLSLPLGGIDGSYRLLSHPEDDVVTSIDTGDTLEGVRVVATSQKDVAALAEEWRSRPDGTEGRGGAEAVISAAERDARSMENRQAELKCR